MGDLWTARRGPSIICVNLWLKILRYGRENLTSARNSARLGYDYHYRYQRT